MKKSFLLCFLLCISAFLFWCARNNNMISNIEYSFGGGYGLLSTTIMKNITFYSDGKVVLSNDYDSYTETIDIGVDNFNELAKFVEKRMFLFDKELKSNDDILDGDYAYLTIELSDNTVKSVWWYMVFNGVFNEIVDKMYEYISDDRLNEYVNNGNWNEKHIMELIER